MTLQSLIRSKEGKSRGKYFFEKLHPKFFGSVILSVVYERKKKEILESICPKLCHEFAD